MIREATMLAVVQTLPALDHGGVERGTLEVASALVRKGHRSIVISAGGRLKQALVTGGSEHIDLPVGRKSLWTLRYVPVLRRLVEEQKVDILHARSRLPAWIEWLAWKGMDPARRPVFITTVHGAYSVNGYSRIMTRGEHVIAVSAFIRQYILDNYPATDPGRIVLIPRGVDPAVYSPDFKHDPSWRAPWDTQRLAGKALLCCPGRITRRKGLEDFVALIQRLNSDGVPVHGLVVGGAQGKNHRFLTTLRRRICAAGSNELFSFLGDRDDLREIMSISTLVAVLAKEPESFGRTALEALSLGVPVLAYDRGGSGEILRELFPQGLVAPDNLETALLKARELIECPPPVGENRVYTLERMLEDTLNLYESAAVRVIHA